jgi:DNA-binding NarL/FixJ family response regulator
MTDNGDGTVRILIADDQALVRAGFRMILEAEPNIEVIGEACDGNEAVKLSAELKPDVVLMDIRMPELDGLEATRRVLSSQPPAGEELPRVLMLTTFDLNEYVYEALRAGASGFLLKDVPAEQLIAGIHVIARGEALLAPSITRRVIEDYARHSSPSRDDRLDQLTERELEVLRLLATGKSNSELAAHLYLGEGTIKTHVSHVLGKLGLRDRVQAVVFAYESGLVEPGQEVG